MPTSNTDYLFGVRTVSNKKATPTIGNSDYLFGVSNTKRKSVNAGLTTPYDLLPQSPSRSFLGDMWSALASGSVSSAEMVLKGLSAFGIDAAEDGLADIAEFRRSSTFDDKSREYLEGGFRKYASDVLESFAQNVGVRLGGITAGAAAGFMAGGLPGAVSGAFIGGVATGGPLYGLAEYYDFMKEAEGSGLDTSELKVKGRAIASGIAEGGLELASDYIFMGIFNPAKYIGKEAAEKLAVSLTREPVRKFITGYLKTAAEEIPTEMMQSWSETAFRNAAGVETDQSPWEAAKSVVGVTAGTSALFALTGMAGDAVGRKAVERRKAAQEIQERISRAGIVTPADIQDIHDRVAVPGSDITTTYLDARQKPDAAKVAQANYAVNNPLFQDMDTDPTTPRVGDAQKQMLKQYGMQMIGVTEMGVWFNDPVIAGSTLVLPENFTEQQLQQRLVKQYKQGWDKFWEKAPEQGKVAAERISAYWDTLAEDMADKMDAFTFARVSGRRAYELEDLAQRFVDYAKEDKTGKPLGELIQGFAKNDEATPSMIKKLRMVVGEMEGKGGVVAQEGGQEPTTLEQREPGPVWYSTLRNVVEQKMPNRASVEDVKRLLGPQSGVKQDELKWTGLQEFLDSRTGPVTKQEVLEAMQDVGVREVVLGDRFDELGYNAERSKIWSDYEAGAIDEEERSRRFRLLDEAFDADKITGTKFSQYQLPGGKNYRELLLTLPDVRDTRNNETSQRLFGKPYDKLSLSEKTSVVNDLASQSPDSRSNFRSSHFGQPNILAHVRFNDRIDADGNKVLFLEEVQSDWHQKGRERGYSNEQITARQVSDGSWTPVVGGREIERGGYSTREDAIRAANEYADRVPAAPFSKTWHEMVMRRMLRWAAENGYDKVAWTTGEQQIDRYIQSIMELSEVEWNEKTGEIIGKHIYGNTVNETGVTKQKLDNYVGKAVARALSEKQPSADGFRKITNKEMGQTIRAGGEFLRLLYEDKIPNYMRQYGKKWGAKVGEVRLRGELTSGETGEKQSMDLPYIVHSIPITPAMRESVMQGQPLFQKGVKGTPSATSQETPPKQSNTHRLLQKRIHQVRNQNAMSDEDYTSILQEATGKTSIATMTDTEIETAYHAIREKVGLLHDIKTPFIGKVQDAFNISQKQAVAAVALAEASGMDLTRMTPERGTAEQEAEGNELSSQKGGKGQIKGMTQFVADSNAIIRGFEQSDLSTAIHEVAHVYRRQFLNKAVPIEQRKGITDTDIDTIEAYVGAVDGKWDVKAEEKYARLVERYVRDGKAPTARLKRIFSGLKKWMGVVYKTVTGTALDLQITPEVKGVLDRIFSVGPRSVAQTARVGQIQNIRRWERAYIKATPEEGREFAKAEVRNVLQKAVGKSDYHQMTDEEVVQAQSAMAQWFAEQDAERLKTAEVSQVPELGPVKKFFAKFLTTLDPAHIAKMRFGPDTVARVLKANWNSDRAMRDLINTKLPSVDKTVEEFRTWLMQFPDEMLDLAETVRSAPADSPEGVMLQEANRKLLMADPATAQLLTPEVQTAIQALNDLVYAYGNKVSIKMTGRPLAYKESYGQGVFKMGDEFLNYLMRFGNTDNEAKLFALSEGFMKRSEFKSYADAFAKGLTHKYQNPIDNAFAELRTIGMLEAMYDLKQDLMMTLGNKSIIERKGNTVPPPDWERVGSVNDPVWRGEVYAEPELARMINNQLQVNQVTHNKTLNRAREVGSMMQLLKFSFTTFHAGSMVKAFIGDCGFLGFLTPKPYAALGQGLSLSTNLQKYRDYIKSDPTRTEYERRIIENGGGHVGAINYYATEHTAIQKFNSIMRSKGVMKAMAHGPKWLSEGLKTPAKFNSWLFEVLIPILKHSKIMEAMAEHKAKTGSEMTDTQLQATIKEIQNIYGAMDERFFGRSGTVTSLMRFFFLAPGFAEGNMRTILMAILKWKGYDKASRSRANIANSFVMTGIMAAVGTAILKGAWPEPPKEPEDLRDMFKIDTGKKDKDGKKIMIDLMTFDRDYFDVFGKVMMPKEIPADMFKRLQGMRSPYVSLVRDMASIMSGQAVYDWKGDKVYHLTDPTLVKVMKGVVHSWETIEPISLSVFKQARQKDANLVTSAVEALLGFRPVRSEQEIRDSQAMRKLYDMREKREELFRSLDDVDNPRRVLAQYNAQVNVLMQSKLISPDVKAEAGKLYTDADSYIGYLVQRLEQDSTTPKTRQRTLQILKQFGVGKAEYEKYVKYRRRTLKQRRMRRAMPGGYMTEYRYR